MNLQRARELRKNATDCERLLWSQLRAHRLQGFKFKRQQPIGSYIVDFVCFEARIIVEADGGQHIEQAEYDARRDAWLRQQGFTVLRFWNNDILGNTEGVMTAIFAACREHVESPSPQPLPRRGGGANTPFAPSGGGAKTPFAPGELLTPLSPGGRGAGGEGEKYGHRTAYLWEDIWARESWLVILGRYLVAHKDSKKQIKKIIFPRFHQLDATRKLLAAVLAEGPGGKYLIQHSAGSGKTNSIAWTAHFLADLHNANHRKLFDTVLVVSDRTVLDTQLQEAIFDFQRTTGWWRRSGASRPAKAAN